MRESILAGLLACGLAACEGPPQATVTADLGLGPSDLSGMDFTTPGGIGRVSIIVTDDESGDPLPARVIVSEVPPTPPVRLDWDIRQTTPCGRDDECPMRPDGRGMDICVAGRCYANGDFAPALSPGVLGAPEGVMLVDGSGAFTLPAGTYDLFITHGPEWEAYSQRVTVGKDDNAQVEASLRHSVDTGGWFAADLHVHTARSFDSQMPVQDRVVSEVVVGVEIIVTTDHNVLSDLQPDVDNWGYHQIAHAIVGDEFNFAEGHGGAYPMPYDPTQMYGGTVEYGLNWERIKDFPSTQMFAFLRTFGTNPAITVNHPRLLPDLGYFTNLTQFGPDGWSPPIPLPDAGKFDALEILNGYMMTPGDLGPLLRDWFFLVNSGFRVTALGSSDTHRERAIKAGFPRTWLRSPTEVPADFDGGALASAVKAGHAVASNGPFALLSVDGAQVGDLVKDTDGQVTVQATVDAPSWIEVDTVRVFVNGKVAKTIPVTRGLRPLVQTTFQLPVPSGDSWVALQAGGKNPLPIGLIGDAGGGEVLPFAITNPVYIDGDGDGKWTPKIANADPGVVMPVDGPPRPAPAHRLPPVEREAPLRANPATWGTP